VSRPSRALLWCIASFISIGVSRVIGIVMLAVFALFAGLMYARVLPALLAVPSMAIVLALLAGSTPVDLAGVLVDGSVRLAPVFAYVIFGALLSRVTMSTGIAETIIGYAAEFGGDQPVVLALTLAAAVAVLFTSLYGS
jgi:H+/gluconate symporter-like permease